MRPTEVLMQEHRVIEQVISCLEEIANRCDAGEPLDTTSALQAIDFFREFADGRHHSKEEDLLFPAMEEKGFAREGGPTGVMLYEHEEGRRHIRGMLEAVEQVSAGQITAQGAFIEHAHGFAELLRQHIFKEDHRLFPMADQALSDSDQNELAQSFDKVDHGDSGPETHQKYIEIANKLADRFGVTKVIPNPGGGDTA